MTFLDAGVPWREHVGAGSSGAWKIRSSRNRSAFYRTAAGDYDYQRVDPGLDLVSLDELLTAIDAVQRRVTATQWPSRRICLHQATDQERTTLYEAIGVST